VQSINGGRAAPPEGGALVRPVAVRDDLLGIQHVMVRLQLRHPAIQSMLRVKLQELCGHCLLREQQPVCGGM
jgi:hypothetical protein